MRSVSLEAKRNYLRALRAFFESHKADLDRGGWNIQFLTEHYRKALDAGEYNSDVVAQLMYITGFLSDHFGETHYAKHIKIMNDKFDLADKNILEVGAGMIPVVSIELAKSYPTSSLKAYDPQLLKGLIDLPPNVELHDEPIVYNKKGNKTDVGGIDFMFGIQPCEGTIPMIELASERSIPYFFAGCCCNHNPKRFNTYAEQAKYWINLAKAKKQRGMEVEVNYYCGQDGEDVPIIMSYRSIGRR